MHALAKVCQKDNNITNLIGENLIEQTRHLIPMFQERLYFRGMGGELMRQACCSFIENCSYAHIPFNNKTAIIGIHFNFY